MSKETSEKETLFFASDRGEIINFEFKKEMNITLRDKLYFTKIVLDIEAIQTLKHFLNRLDLKDSYINKN